MAFPASISRDSQELNKIICRSLIPNLAQTLQFLTVLSIWHSFTPLHNHDFHYANFHGNHTRTTQLCDIPCKEFYTNRKKNVENSDKLSFTPLNVFERTDLHAIHNFSRTYRDFL